LDGYWWVDDEPDSDFRDKSKYRWTAMLRQPEFVTPELFEKARAIVAKKKPGLDLSKARLVRFREGLCVQCMHIGPFSTEAETIRKMMDFTGANGLAEDFSDTRRHHEIYLSDPRKGDPAKMKTILRHPVKRL
ncbi:MAG: GyrI-like domain-containing protein, partial [Clostridiales bacterium]|nr:GyrI-like domain-containing protein [Clostridiales bacterium]